MLSVDAGELLDCRLAEAPSIEIILVNKTLKIRPDTYMRRLPLRDDVSVTHGILSVCLRKGSDISRSHISSHRMDLTSMFSKVVTLRMFDLLCACKRGQSLALLAHRLLELFLYLHRCGVFAYAGEEPQRHHEREGRRVAICARTSARKFRFTCREFECHSELQRTNHACEVTRTAGPQALDSRRTRTSQVLHSLRLGETRDWIRFVVFFEKYWKAHRNGSSRLITNGRRHVADAAVCNHGFAIPDARRQHRVCSGLSRDTSFSGNRRHTLFKE